MLTKKEKTHDHIKCEKSKGQNSTLIFFFFIERVQVGKKDRGRKGDRENLKQASQGSYMT